MNNNNTKYKDSPLGKIPGDWKVKTIEEIAMKEKGAIKIGPFGSQLRKEEFIKNGIKIYDQETAFNGDFFSGSNFISEKKYQSLKSCELKTGDIIISMMGTIGASAIVPLDAPKGILNSHLLRVRPDKSIIIEDFLKLSISDSPFTVNQIKRKSHGGIMSGLSAGIIRSIEIVLPPLPEQKAIAHVLGLMDSAINTNNRLIAQKELQKKWLMQNLLTGKKRLRGYEKENWEETSLGDLFERITRKNAEQNTNVVTISAQRGFVRQTDFFNKSIASEIVDNYFLVEEGEFCYNKSYSNGYPWGATKRLKDFEKAVVTTLYICFGLKEPHKNSGDFFEHFFEANLLDKGLTKIAHEGGRAHGLLNVTPSDFFSLKITIPSPDEQTAIAKVLQAANKEIQLLKSKTEKLREQKEGLMQVLLTGKKRLKIKL
jgi:type I restriction enzyme S subunit